uniref:SGNH hydrolase-type esterase domain-containing protein n=1 Tax=Solibacter usitatus (strain Ellin6076) TaxID=234267 RepID=Q01S84_SOLUE
MKKTIFFAQIAFALLAVPAFAGNDKNYTYLALGDSIPFGMNILLIPPYASQFPTPSQFVGYPETVGSVEHLLTSKKLVNASCPGESSGSFLNVNLLDYGCNSPHPLPDGTFLPAFKPSFGLKADYSGTTSQMDFAEAQLASNKHIDAVTLSIGANDALLVVPQLLQCGQDKTCATNVLKPVLDNYAGNLIQILSRIRAKYNGRLVLLTYYSPDPRLDDVAVAVNTVMTAVASNPAFGPVHFADGFNAFQTASALFGGDACKAGLLIRLPAGSPTPCDIHPSPIGRDILAAIVEVALHE